MKILHLLTLLMVMTGLLVSCQEPKGNSSDYSQLKAGFLDPTGTARPKVYWWWLNGNVDTVRALEEMEAMKKAGIGGFDIFEIGVPASDSLIPAGPTFMGDSSLELIQFAIREAERLNLDVGLNLASSWNAGGSWTPPQNQSKKLYSSKVKVKGGSRQVIRMPFPVISNKDKNGQELIAMDPDGKPVYYEEVAIVAVPAHPKPHSLDTGHIMNLSSFFDADKGLLSWDAPSGDWDVYRYVCSNSGQQLVLPSPHSHGPIIDHFDSAASRYHLQYFINQLKPVIGDLSRSALNSFYMASYEARGTVWTPTLPDVFYDENGYPIYKFLPALLDTTLLSGEIRKQFTADYKRTLSRLMIQNLYQVAKTVSNEAGLKINSEAGGPGQPLHNVPAEPLKALGTMDIPRGEFWNKYHYFNEDSINIMQVVKEVAAAAHIYGRKLVEEESFTSFRHWQEGPGELKPLADRAFCEGMNRVVMHGFSHSPGGTGYPGNVYHAGTHFSDKNPWWPMMGAFVSYLSRISFIQQSTDFKADVLHYYGDYIPNYVAPKNTRFKVGKGYDYEVINTDLLEQVVVKDSQLVLPNGGKFRILSLGGTEAIRPKVLTKLKKLAAEGAIITGPKPELSIGLSHQPQADSMVQTVSKALWDTTTVFKPELLENGKIFSRLSPLQLLQGIGVSPDFTCRNDSGSTLDYIHTEKGDMDFYFIRNTTNQWVSRYGLFRQTGKSPELWNPMNGEMIPLPIYEQQASHIEIPLTLPPRGAYFVVFRKSHSSRSHYTNLAAVETHPPLISYTQNGIHFLQPGSFQLSESDGIQSVRSHPHKESIEGPWKVVFSKGWGAPDSTQFSNLRSWTDSKVDGIKYYSGTAVYYNTFEYKVDTGSLKNQRLYLDLGDLSEIGKVWLNGKLLGVAWTPPYRFDVTSIIRQGKNELKIEVANTWSNRLTGDAITGEQYTRTNIKTSIPGVPWRETPLIESGLLGPVTLKRIMFVK